LGPDQKSDAKKPFQKGNEASQCVKILQFYPEKHALFRDYGVAYNFNLHERENVCGRMLREVLQLVQIKSLAENSVNCWLSYQMSQPVQFDMAILMLFALEYFGLVHIRTIISFTKASTGWLLAKRELFPVLMKTLR
jgi:hypothetical protein